VAASLEAVLSLLEAHPYLLLFPLVMLEEPIVTICAGFLVSAGLASWPVAYAIAVTADLTADTFYYLLGRSARRPRIRRLVRRLGLTEGRRERLEWEVRKNGARTLVGAKVADAAAIPVLVATGLAGTGYGRFLAWNAAATLPKAAALMALGFFFGEQAVRYLDRTSALAALLALALVAFLAARVLSKRINKTNKEDNYEHLDR